MGKLVQTANLDALTIDEVADLLLVTDRTVRNWLDKKEMPSVSGGRGRRFDWSVVLPWYVRMMADADGNRRKSGNEDEGDDYKRLSHANLRRTIAEADLRELDLAARRGQVVAVEDVARNLTDVAKSLQIEILGWPTRIVGRIFGMRDRNQLFSVLTESARELCTRLAGVGDPQPVPEAPGADV